MSFSQAHSQAKLEGFQFVYDGYSNTRKGSVANVIQSPGLDRIIHAVRNPSPMTFTILGIVIVVMGFAAWGVRSWVLKNREGKISGEPAYENKTQNVPVYGKVNQ